MLQVLNKVEEGTYGVVYRAIVRKTKEIVALKRLKMEKEKDGRTDGRTDFIILQNNFILFHLKIPRLILSIGCSFRTLKIKATISLADQMYEI